MVEVFTTTSKIIPSLPYFNNIQQYPLHILSPQKEQAHLLDNQITIGTEGESVKILTTVLIGEEATNALSVSITMNNTSLALSILTKIEQMSLKQIPLRHITNPYCWLSSIPAPILNEFGVRDESISQDVTLDIDAFDILYGDLNVSVDCVACKSPQVELIAQSLNEGLADVLSIAFIRRFLNSNFVQDQIDLILHEANNKCPSASQKSYNTSSLNSGANEFIPMILKEYVDDSYKVPLAFAVIVSCAGIIVFGVTSFRKKKLQKKHDTWFSSATTNELFIFYQKQNRKVQEEMILCRDTKSMAMSSCIPIFVRILMPLIILGNVALFLSGHLSLGASVEVVAETIGEEINMPTFFEFSMAKSTIESWQAGAKSLAIIILIFSGIWPYTKQFITLYLWFTPPSSVSVSKRGSIFVWLDALAKWSMIDIYILIITIVGFRISIKSPEFLSESLYTVDLMVVPLWGLYANMMAQLVSQISSHYIIHYHNKIEQEGRRAIKDHNLNNNKSLDEANDLTNHHNDELENVCGHSYRIGCLQDSPRVKIRKGVNVFVIFLGFLSILFLVLGCTLPSLRLELFGLLGLIYEAGNQFEEAVAFHSILTIAQLIFDQANFIESLGQYFGLTVLITLMFLTAFLVPIVLVITLLCVWFVPMRRRRRNQILVSIDILKAWQYIEVYIISIIVAAWQLGGISEFMFNEEYCKDYDEEFSIMEYYGLINEEDSAHKCFYNKADVWTGAIFLTLAAIMISWLSNFVLKATKQKHNDDDDNETFNAAIDTLTEISNEESTSNTDIKPPTLQFTDIFQLYLVKCDKFDESENVESAPVNPELFLTLSSDRGAEIMPSPKVASFFE